MKKIVLITTGILVTMSASAQGSYMEIRPMIEISATIFTFVAVMLFILAIIKRILEYRLKNKIVDKGIPESVITTLLESAKPEGKESNIKWFSLLAGLGAGLMIVNYTLPLGFHSVAIMAFSISLSFLGYYFFLKNTGKGS